MARKIIFAFFALLFLLLNSCFLKTTGTLRKEIMKKNSELAAVGVILDWTNSDNKFIALELKLEDNKTFFLTLVNYRKLPEKEPFYLNKVGNYTFARIAHIINKETNENGVELRTDLGYSLPKLSANTGIEIKTIGDLIKYYDDINAFIESLPIVNETNYQEIFEEEVLIKDAFGENEYNFITLYLVKTLWDDKYYGTEMKNGKECWRRPDYDNNETIVFPDESYFLWLFRDYDGIQY